MFFEAVLGLRFCVFLLVDLDYYLYYRCYVSYLSSRLMSIFNKKTQVKMDSSFWVFSVFCLLYLCLSVLILLILGYLNVMF